MLHYRSKLIQNPTKRIYHKGNLQHTHPARISLGHEGKIETQKNDELDDLKDIPGAWNHETVLVEERCLSWFIQRDGSLLVVIRDEIHVAGGCVYDTTDVDRINPRIRLGDAQAEHQE